MRLIPVSSNSDCSPTRLSDTENSHSLLYLNVYDLTPINDYLYWIGLGIFHSGIEAHELEYGFGAHEYPTSGVFEVQPRSCPGFIFRRSILLGSTNMSRTEFRSFMEDVSNDYHGDTYHSISKNCNHFTDEICVRLTGRSIPGWVNRLARLGVFCDCLLPESIRVTSVTNLHDHQMYSENATESDATSSAGENEEENIELHLLTTPNSSVALLKDRPGRLTEDIL